MSKTILTISLYFISIFIFSQNTQKLKVGDEIPRFFLEDQNGNFFDSENFKNKQPIIIFFFPKAGAPVCTAQACLFRDYISKFKELGAKIIGISPDSASKQKTFIKDNKLPYTVLSDKKNRIRKLFGVPSLFLSNKPKRYTFIIDKKGIIKRIYYSKKDIESHIEQALTTLYKDSNNNFSIQK
jgi:peroxiredoxin Q/BCP